MSDLGAADPATDDNTNADDDLDILGQTGDRSLNITTLGTPKAVINGNGLTTGNRVFDLVPNGNATTFMTVIRLSNLVITGGNTNGNMGNGTIGDGGAIQTNSFATSTEIVSSHIHENIAAGGGGAMRLGADMTITDSWIEDNSAEGAGAIWAEGEGDITIAGSTLSLNSSVDGFGFEGDAGALMLSGSNPLSGSVTMVNSTVFGNQASGDAGGIHTFGGTGMELTVASSTIAGNIADSDTDMDGGDAGGVLIAGPPGPVATFRNTIIGDNVDNGGQIPDCSGPVTSQGYNLLESTAGSCDGAAPLFNAALGDLLGLDPKLATLATDVGAPTPTMALLPGSPALNAGNPFTPTGDGLTGPACPANDQTVSSRVPYQPCDIGAYEIKDLDTDNDKFWNSVDPCPNQAGTTNGCPPPVPVPTPGPGPVAGPTGLRAAALKKCKKKKSKKARKKCKKRALRLPV